MFDHVSDGGVGFQLSMYRLLDDFEDARRMGSEAVLLAKSERLRSEYNRLLAYAQGLERDLNQRNQQLAKTQEELARVQAAYAHEQWEERQMMIVRQDRARAREQERLLGSQPT